MSGYLQEGSRRAINVNWDYERGARSDKDERDGCASRKDEYRSRVELQGARALGLAVTSGSTPPTPPHPDPRLPSMPGSCTSSQPPPSSAPKTRLCLLSPFSSHICPTPSPESFRGFTIVYGTMKKKLSFMFWRGQAAAATLDDSRRRVRSGMESIPYGGEYLQRIVELLEKGKESRAADASRTDALSKQVEVLHLLREAMGIRRSEDVSLYDPVEGGSKGTEFRGIRFDDSVDEDEVLLRLFREVDADGSGTISMEELLEAPLLRKKENMEMARALRRALGCDLRALEEALASLEEADLGLYTQQGEGGESVAIGHAVGRSAAVKTIFDAVGPSWRPEITVPPEANQAAGGSAGEVDTRMATRADFDRFLAAVEAPVKGSALASAIAKLAVALPEDGQLDFLALKEVARNVPRVAAQRLEWVRTMGLDAALARHLPPGTLDDG